jgi:hypothetical protein
MKRATHFLLYTMYATHKLPGPRHFQCFQMSAARFRQLRHLALPGCRLWLRRALAFRPKSSLPNTFTGGMQGRFRSKSSEVLATLALNNNLFADSSARLQQINPSSGLRHSNSDVDIYSRWFSLFSGPHARPRPPISLHVSTPVARMLFVI